MKELKDFLRDVNAHYAIYGVEVNIDNKRFGLGREIEGKVFSRNRLVYAGKLLGRTKDEYIPSSTILQEVGKSRGSNRVWVSEDVGWLFACGRDIFTESILKSEGNQSIGSYSLVMLGDDCLGYGSIKAFDGKIILKNIFDIGDFLRRERKN